MNYPEKNKLNTGSLRRNDKDLIEYNRCGFILKWFQIFSSIKHNIFAEEVNKIALSAKVDKRIKSMDSIQPYGYSTSEKIMHKNKGIKFSNITK